MKDVDIIQEVKEDLTQKFGEGSAVTLGQEQYVLSNVLASYRLNLQVLIMR